MVPGLRGYKRIKTYIVLHSQRWQPSKWKKMGVGGEKEILNKERDKEGQYEPGVLARK